MYYRQASFFTIIIIIIIIIITILLEKPGFESSNFLSWLWLLIRHSNYQTTELFGFIYLVLENIRRLYI